MTTRVAVDAGPGLAKPAVARPVVPGRSPTANSAKLMVRSPSMIESFLIVTGKVCFVSFALKLTVPDPGVKSRPGTAVPGVTEYATTAGTVVPPERFSEIRAVPTLSLTVYTDDYGADCMVRSGA